MRTHTQTHRLILIARADTQNSFIYVCNDVCFWRNYTVHMHNNYHVDRLMDRWYHLDTHTQHTYYCCVYLLMLISLVKSAAKLYSINVVSASFCLFYTNETLLWIPPAAEVKWRFALFRIRPSFWECIHAMPCRKNEMEIWAFASIRSREKFKCNWQSHAIGIPNGHTAYAAMKNGNEKWLSWTNITIISQVKSQSIKNTHAKTTTTAARP